MLVSVNFGCFSRSRFSHFHCNTMRKAIKAHKNLHTNQQQEYIPVSCVLPTAVGIPGGLQQAPSPGAAPLAPDPPRSIAPWEQASPRTRHPRDQTPPGAGNFVAGGKSEHTPELWPSQHTGISHYIGIPPSPLYRAWTSSTCSNFSIH